MEETNQELEDLLHYLNLPAALGAPVRALRISAGKRQSSPDVLVHAADPEASETIKRSRQPYFVLQGNICALLAARDHVNVFVYDGGIVPDRIAAPGAVRRGVSTITRPGLGTVTGGTRKSAGSGMYQNRPAAPLCK